MTTEEQREEETAEVVVAEHNERVAPFAFSFCNIQPGEYVEWYDDPNMTFLVVDDKKVEYKGKKYSLSGLAAELTGKSSSAGIAGPTYFKYKGEWLNNIRFGKKDK